MVASGLPERLASLAREHHLKLGIYIDDILLSGDIEPKRLKRLFVRIVSESGFHLSQKKLEEKYARLAHERQEGPGVTLNRKVNAPKAYVRTLRATLHGCRAEGPLRHVPAGKTCEIFRQSLVGRIAYVRTLNPRTADNLLVEFMRVDWENGGASPSQ